MIKAGVYYATYGHWTLSLLNAGYKVVWHFQPNIKEPRYRDSLASLILTTNFPRISQEVSKVNFICGSPPCIGFSRGNPKAGPKHWANKNFINCFKEIARIKPKWFLIEMVPRIYKVGKKYLALAMEQVSNYYIDDYIFEIDNYGCPARRKRVYFFGSLEKVKFSLGDLPTKPKIGCQEILEKYREKYDNFKADARILLSIYKVDGKTLRKGPFSCALQKSRILKPNKPVFTITGMAYANMIHYSKRRFLAIPEIADLMGFPPNYKYVKHHMQTIVRIIASGVDIRFTSYLLKYIKENIINER